MNAVRRPFHRAFGTVVLLTLFAAVLLRLSTSVLHGAIAAVHREQSQPAVLSGRVIDAASGRPVRAASVTVKGGRNYAPTFLTGADGRFQFSDVPAGALDLAATKPGFFDSVYGQRRPQSDGPGLDVRPGQRIDAIELRLWPVGVITGRVTGDDGTPIAGVSVSCAPSDQMRDGAWPAGVPAATTDDTGVYTLATLIPGDYIVGVALTYRDDPNGVANAAARAAASPRRTVLFGESSSGSPIRIPQTTVTGPIALSNRPGHTVAVVGATTPPEIIRDGRRFAYTSAFYPATTSVAQAAPVTVAAGQERSGIDLTLRLQPAFEVSGVVIGPSGSMVATQLVLAGSDRLTTHAQADGTFVFPIVPPGTYELRAGVDMAAMNRPTPALLPDERNWARQTVIVGDRDVDGVTVALRRGIVLRGRIEFDVAPPAGALEAMSGGVFSAGGSMTTAGPIAIAANGTFASVGLQPGRYTLRVSDAPHGWSMGAVEAHGRDHTDVPIDVTEDVDGIVIRVIKHVAAIGGSVRDERGGVAQFAVVVIWPADPHAWATITEGTKKTRRVRPANGRYEIADLPPGNYLVRAVDDEDLAGWPSPEASAKLAVGAQAVTLLPGTRVERHLVARAR